MLSHTKTRNRTHYRTRRDEHHFCPTAQEIQPGTAIKCQACRQQRLQRIIDDCASRDRGSPEPRATDS